LVLLGEKSSGKRYRPDEIALLSTGIHQLGLDLESLRVVELEQIAAASRHHAEALEQKLVSSERLSAAFQQNFSLSEERAHAIEREAAALRELIRGGVGSPIPQ
jgi:methyl-accepting chemotaxis protein